MQAYFSGLGMLGTVSSMTDKMNQAYYKSKKQEAPKDGGKTPVVAFNELDIFNAYTAQLLLSRRFGEANRKSVNKCMEQFTTL